jgi:hypothetical protein
MSCDLPEGWHATKLEEIGTLYCGQSPATESVNTEGRGTPYVTGPEQWDGVTLHASKWTTDPNSPWQKCPYSGIPLQAASSSGRCFAKCLSAPSSSRRPKSGHPRVKHAIKASIHPQKTLITRRFRPWNPLGVPTSNRPRNTRLKLNALA